MAIKEFFSKKRDPDSELSADEKRVSAAPSSVPSISDRNIDEKPEDTVAPVPSDSDSQQAQEDEDESQYPHGLKLLLITIALCLAVFCVALDNTIIATAIPRITDEFKSINDVGWYGSAYLLTTCAFQLFYGKLYSYLKLKWVFLAALLIFEVGSIVCAAAPNSTALIIGRAVAGLGCAGLFSGALLIVANTVPLRTRPSYTGLIGAWQEDVDPINCPGRDRDIERGSCQDFHLRLCARKFSSRSDANTTRRINPILGVVTAAFIFVFYNAESTAKSLDSSNWMSIVRQFDPFGMLVFLPMIICLLLALQWGGSQYQWSDGRIIALLVIFGVLVIVFVGIQIWQQDNATVPPRVLKQRTVGASAFFSFCLGASFFVFVYYIPIWFQAIQEVDATSSGVRTIPMVLSLVIFSVVSGGLVTAFGYYTPFVLGSTLFMSVGAGMLTTWTVHTNSAEWIGYQILYGVGVGFGMQQTMIAVQTVLPRADIPVGTSIVMFSQTLGGALFISVAQNIFTNRLLHNVLSNVPGLDPSLVLSSGATELKNRVGEQFLGAVQVAYNGAIINTFYVGVAMGAMSFFGAIFIEWKSVKGKKIEMAAGA